MGFLYSLGIFVGVSQAKQFRVCCEFIPVFLFTLFLLSASFLPQFFQFQLVSRTPAQTNSSSHTNKNILQIFRNSVIQSETERENLSGVVIVFVNPQSAPCGVRSEQACNRTQQQHSTFQFSSSNKYSVSELWRVVNNSAASVHRVLDTLSELSQEALPGVNPLIEFQSRTKL